MERESSSRQALNDARVYSDGKPRRESTGCVDFESIVAALSLVNAALGAGVLAYPFAFMSAGLLTANVVTACIGLLSFSSLNIVMHSMAVLQERYGRSAVTCYGDLVSVALGSRASVLLEVLIVAYMFGASVGYLSVLRDVFNGFAHDDFLARIHLSRTDADLLVMVATSVVCFLLCVPRQIKALKYSAAAAVLAVLFTVGTLVYQAIIRPCRPNDCTDGEDPAKHGWSNSTWPPELGVSLWPESLSSVLKAFPLICFAFQCHIQCAELFSELSPRVRKSVSRRRRISTGATLLTLALYFPAGIAGFVRFGDATQGDILYNFSPTSVPANAARICMGLTALTAYPCQHYPARTILYKVWRKCCASMLRQSRGETMSRLTELSTSDGGGIDGEGGRSKPEIPVSFALIEAAVWSIFVLGTAAMAQIANIKLDKIFQVCACACVCLVCVRRVCVCVCVCVPVPPRTLPSLPSPLHSLSLCPSSPPPPPRPPPPPPPSPLYDLMRSLSALSAAAPSS
jgi:amino acid permease